MTEPKTTRARGNVGEDAVCRYLEAQGYTVVARNYVAHHAELDIVAQKADTLAFVEVKTRTATPYSSRYGRPATAITAQKWAHLFTAARAYLCEFPSDCKPRMDVAEVYLSSTGEVLQIRYYPSAYRA